MINVRTGKFKHEISNQFQDWIVATSKIIACFLAQSLHVLIDQQLVAELNAGIDPKIAIKYLLFEERSHKIKRCDVF